MITTLPGALPRAGQRRVLAVLCATEITSWGVLYYAFVVLAPTIATTTGWSPAAVTAAFSAGQIVAALAGIVIGKVLDHRGPRVVMTTGSILAVLSLLGIAHARTIAEFTACWLAAGVAMSAVLYQPAFAALTRWSGDRRVTALTTLTLAGGLASTVFAPITAALLTHLGWRHTYLALAAVLAFTIPAHALGLRGPWHPVAARPHSAAPPARTRTFLLLALAMSLSAFAASAVIVGVVPLFTERGLTIETAALALGLGGIGQVCGRLAYPRLAAATSVTTRTALVLTTAATTITLLAILPGPATALIAIVLVLGGARGLTTLLNATAISDRWDTRDYARLSGILTAPIAITAALAPWAETTLAESLGGHDTAFLILAAATATAALLATKT
ncbi:integral membrane transport protein [Alloactinosynnema sp. L-07]|uniref:MFS transporter n=1 Tax=Alloactinosynnema sp. L-07 TaxID=1653480 RepID=UPI00065EF296|nr:MFS transporter [Alloactinosynnema sp. L-07]CRK56662.1 integral membrane transport protein [Alloactinosynnema sp. L-07]